MFYGHVKHADVLALGWWKESYDATGWPRDVGKGMGVC